MSIAFNSPIIYSLPPFFTALFFISIGYFLLKKNPSHASTITFFLLCLTTAIWQGAWSILFQTRDPIISTVVAKIGYFFIIFLPTFLYHFLIEISEKKEERKWVTVSYTINLCFAAILIGTDTLFIDGTYAYFWGHYPKAGLLHPLHVVQSIVIALRGLWIVYKKQTSPTSSPELKKQLTFIIVSLFIYFLASIDYLCNYGFGFYPPGIIFITLSLSLIFYATLKLNLMDIKLIISKSTSFFLSFSAYTLLFGALFFGETFLLHPLPPILLYSTGLAALFLTALTFHKVQNHLQTFSDWVIFRKKVETETLTKLISTLHHQIKSPLTAILMSADFLLLSSQQEKEQKLLTLIKSDVKRIESLLNHLKNLQEVKETEYVGNVKMIHIETESK